MTCGHGDHSGALEDETDETRLTSLLVGGQTRRRFRLSAALSAAVFAIVTVAVFSGPRTPGWSAERNCAGDVAPRATFRTHAPGSPLRSQAGRWEVDGNRATLRFAGAHAFPAASRFTATWVTPLSQSKKRHQLRVQSHIESVNPAGTGLRVTEELRFREAGACWSAWEGLSDSPSGMVETYETNLRAPIYLPSPGRVQYQWRLRGYLPAPTVLTGGAQASHR